MKTKFKTKKLLALVLSLAMIVGMVPMASLTALAYDGNPYSSLEGTTTTVTFNGKPWYIIADNSTAVDAGTVTLLVADTSFGMSKFNSTKSSDNYSISTVKSVLDSCTESGGSFANVASAIEDTENGKLYLLSMSEANKLSQDVRKLGVIWWLRTPGHFSGYGLAPYVSADGGIPPTDSGVKSNEYYVRPALKLDLSKVTFDSESKTFSVGIAPAHTHSFTYVAGAGENANTITATCGEGCDITEGLTLTISAPTGELTADGTTTFPATLNEDHNTTAFPGTYSITYTKDGAAFTGTPTEAGAYVASVTVGDATASVSYTIAAAATTAYGDLLNTTTVVHFDGKDWYLIEDNSTAANAGTVTLLAKECVAASQYNSSGSFVEYSSNPTVKTAVDNYYNSNISTDAKTAVSGGMFLLTTAQANAITSADVRKCSQYSGTSYNGWWLCSQGFNFTYAAFVYGSNGNVNDDGYSVFKSLGVRPALKLDLSKVEFDSETKTFALPAKDPVPYMAWDETDKTVKDVEGGCTDYTVVTNTTTAFEDGKWYVVNGEVTVESRITVTGTVNLILCDGAKLNANEGIALTSGKTLNIYGQSNGTGELTARGGEKIAGIGGGNKEHAGNVTIHGGVVYANGGTNGAGIGGGNEGNGGKVTINGGKVYATGGTNGAGIGGGDYANGGIVTVNGGTVDAKTIGNTSATSIGNGRYKSNTGSLIVASTHVAYSSNSPITDENKTSATAIQGSGAAMNIARQHYMLVEEGNLHSHNFTYSADGAAITAECKNTNCFLTADPILTIVAPEKTKYNDGKDAKATLTGLAKFNEDTGLTVSADDIKYYETEEIDIDGNKFSKVGAELAQAPTGAGQYVAGLTLGNVKVSETETRDIRALVWYTIAKATPEHTAPTGLKAVAGNTLESVTLPDGWTWADDTTTIENKGLNTFKATFTPEDTTNYNTVENVDINVNVFEYHDEVPAECEKDGSTAYYEDGEGHKFSDLGETPLTDEQTVIEKLGHSFIHFLKWVWDGFNHAVAWLFCDNNPEHIETIDVPSQIDTVDEPTCTEDGYKYYVATIDVAGKIYTTVNVETLDQLGHKWKESEWTIDGTKASVTLVCEHDPNHTKTVDAAVGVTVNEEGTLRTYTTKVTVDGVEYTKTWTEDIAVPTPDVPTPDVPTPDVPTPDVPTPDVPTPDVPTPDVPTPDVPTPDEPTPDKPTPDEPTPDKPTPDEPTPDKPTPDVPTPDVPTPDVPTPDVPTPDVPTPDVPTPDVPTPDVPTPDVPTPDEPTPDKPTPDEPTPDKPTPDEPTPDKPTPDEPTPIEVGLLGDVNNDGQVDSADALLILRASVELDKLTDDQKLLADVNGDGNIDSADALDVLRYSVQLSANEKIGTPVSKTAA